MTAFRSQRQSVYLIVGAGHGGGFVKVGKSTPRQYRAQMRTYANSMTGIDALSAWVVHLGDDTALMPWGAAERIEHAAAGRLGALVAGLVPVEDRLEWWTHPDPRSVDWQLMFVTAVGDTLDFFRLDAALASVLDPVRTLTFPELPLL